MASTRIISSEQNQDEQSFPYLLNRHEFESSFQKCPEADGRHLAESITRCGVSVDGGNAVGAPLLVGFEKWA